MQVAILFFQKIGEQVVLLLQQFIDADDAVLEVDVEGGGLLSAVEVAQSHLIATGAEEDAVAEAVSKGFPQELAVEEVVMQKKLLMLMAEASTP